MNIKILEATKWFAADLEGSSMDGADLRNSSFYLT
jgi:uncharacterized protein YjbI with pentapeptide repeats